MKVKALKSFATKYGSAEKEEIIKVSDADGGKLIELKFAEKITKSPQPPKPPQSGDDE